MCADSPLSKQSYLRLDPFNCLLSNLTLKRSISRMIWTLLAFLVPILRKFGNYYTVFSTILRNVDYFHPKEEINELADEKIVE
jgi:hypothetical protein